MSKIFLKGNLPSRVEKAVCLKEAGTAIVTRRARLVRFFVEGEARRFQAGVGVEELFDNMGRKMNAAFRISCNELWKRKQSVVSGIPEISSTSRLAGSRIRLAYNHVHLKGHRGNLLTVSCLVSQYWSLPEQSRTPKTELIHILYINW